MWRDCPEVNDTRGGLEVRHGYSSSDAEAP